MAFRLKASDTFPQGSTVKVLHRVGDSPTEEVGTATMGARYVDLQLAAGTYLACNGEQRMVAFTVTPAEAVPLEFRLPRHTHSIDDVDGLREALAALKPIKKP